MNTYLITGGAGFIGSNYINYMLCEYGNDINIINLDKLTYAGNLDNLKEVEALENYSFIKADICDKDIVENIFEENDIDYCINFAAESHVDRSIKNPEIFVQTNVIGTLVLLDTAKKYWQTANSFKNGKKFVQISTDEVYGSLGSTGYFTEETPLDPHSPYSASKASADLLVKSYADTFGMPVNITRCSNNYGPFQFPEKLIPFFINNALNGKNLPVYGDGKNIRDWIYVLDHVRSIDVVTQKGRLSEVYNIGGHSEKQNIEISHIIIDSITELLDASDERRSYVSMDLIKYVEDRKGHDRRYAIDSAKIENELNWQPHTTFEDGMRKTIKWYMDNSLWVKNVTSRD